MSAATTKPKQQQATSPKPPTLANARKALGAFGAKIDESVSEGGRIMLRIGMALAGAEALVKQVPKALPKATPTFVDWAKSHYDVSQPRIDLLVRAGRVATVLFEAGCKIDGSVSEDVLGNTFHKVLNDSASAATRSEREGNLVRLWNKTSKDGRCKIWQAKQALALNYPALAEGGARGPKAGTEAAKGNGSATKAKQSGKAAPAKSRTADAPSVEVEHPAITEFRVKRSTAALAKIRGTIADESWNTMRNTMLTLVDLLEQCGPASVRKAFEHESLAPIAAKQRSAAKPKQQQSAAPKRTAAKRTAK